MIVDSITSTKNSGDSSENSLKIPFIIQISKKNLKLFDNIQAYSFK